ncbi:MAG: hypothetical protein AAF804_13215 [Bacteroidota bacterium]
MTTLLVCWLAIPLRGQGNGEELPASARDQLEAFKIAFFTRRLSLTPNEAKRFWPVYNNYARETEELRSAERGLQNRMKEVYRDGTDAELEKLSDEYIELQRKEFQIRAKYHRQFKLVLPIRKVVQLYRAEADFKKELLQEIRRRRQDRLRN